MITESGLPPLTQILAAPLARALINIPMGGKVDQLSTRQYRSHLKERIERDSHLYSTLDSRKFLIKKRDQKIVSVTKALRYSRTNTAVWLCEFY